MAVFNTIFQPFGPVHGFAKGAITQTKSVLLTMLGCLVITACTGVPIVSAPSENFNSRVNHVVIHFTSEDFERSLAILTGETERRVPPLEPVLDVTVLSWETAYRRVHGMCAVAAPGAFRLELRKARAAALAASA